MERIFSVFRDMLASSVAKPVLYSNNGKVATKLNNNDEKIGSIYVYNTTTTKIIS